MSGQSGKVKAENIEIRIRGRNTWVPSIHIGKCKVITTGGWLKTAQLFDEELVEESDWPDPIVLASELRQSGFRADVFTFAQRTTTREPEYEFPFEWDNFAVVATESFETWWTALPQESRKNARRAEKRGVVVRQVEFDEALARGIKRIYDETPFRQGRRFWHYQKDLASVTSMNSTYLERSRFIGAFIGEELVGFIKYIRVDRTAVLIQIIAMEAHRDARVIYALLRQAIETCEREGMSQLTYGKFNYGVNQDSTLSEFKRRTGFSELRYRRYFVPLTPLGRLAVATGLHLGWQHFVPLSVTTFLHRARSRLVRTAAAKRMGAERV